MFFPILFERKISLNEIIRQDNDGIRAQFIFINFGFFCKNNVTRSYLRKEGVHFSHQNSCTVL